MARRGHGEGSIHRRKDGRYVAVVDLGYESGKRRRKYFYGKTRGEVQKKLVKANRDLQLGLPAPSDRLTVAGFLDSWLENSVRNILKPRTVESYEMVVRLHLRPALGRVALTKLTPERVQKYLNQKLETGLSPRTVTYHRAVLRSALGKAEKWGQVARNVAKLADPPRVPKTEVKPLSQEEVQQLLQTARGDWLEALYVCAVALGMRQGELLGLRWEDVDLEGRTLTVAKALQRLDGRFQLVERKATHPRRKINLPQIVVSALGRHRARQSQGRLLAGPEWVDDWGLVFVTRRGTPIDASNLVRAWHQLLERAGLPRCRFHDLRHTAASLLLSQHVDPRVVMEILGHSQISLTMNTYAHVMPALQREAADSMDRVLRGAV